MSDLQHEPPPRRSPRRGVITGIIILIALIVVGSIAVFHGIGGGSSAISTPTVQPAAAATSASWTLPGMSCSDAVQKIEQHQISYVLIYRNKDGGPAVAANAITGIEVLPQGIPYQGDPAQTVENSFTNIDISYPDSYCYPQVLAAVKQVNQHLSKSEQVKVGWHYDLS